MTDEQKERAKQKLTGWEAEKLLQAFVYYSQHFSPIDFNDESDDNIKYYLVKAEILRRME